MHLQDGRIQSISSDAQGFIHFWAQGVCDPLTAQSGDQNNTGQAVRQPVSQWNAAYDRVQGYCNVGAGGYEWKLTFPPKK